MAEVVLLQAVGQAQVCPMNFILEPRLKEPQKLGMFFPMEAPRGVSKPSGASEGSKLVHCHFSPHSTGQTHLWLLDTNRIKPKCLSLPSVLYWNQTGYNRVAFFKSLAECQSLRCPSLPSLQLCSGCTFSSQMDPSSCFTPTGLGIYCQSSHTSHPECLFLTHR